MLSWKELLEVLSRTLDISPEKRSTLVARIQAMQKPPYSFPHGGGVGKGGRATYSPDQLMQLIYVFKLLDFWAPQGAAIGFVLEEWSMLAKVTGEALLMPDYGYPHGNFLAIHPDGIGGLRDPKAKAILHPRQADPDFPYKPGLGLVALRRNQVTEGLVIIPEWFDGAALLYVPTLVTKVAKNVAAVGASMEPLLESARKWVAD